MEGRIRGKGRGEDLYDTFSSSQGAAHLTPAGIRCLVETSLRHSHIISPTPLGNFHRIWDLPQSRLLP